MKVNRKKLRKQFLVRSFFFLLLIVLLIFGGYYYTWSPLIRIQAPIKQINLIKMFIREKNKGSILSLKNLDNLDWNQLKAPLTTPVLHRKIPFLWSLHFSEKFQTRYVYLNKYIREVDIEGNLLSKPYKEAVQASSLLYYYPIEIQSVQTSIDDVYEEQIAPLIAYLFQSDSGLGPKVRYIQFNPDNGITLTVFQKPCLIGFITENPVVFLLEIEKKILKLEEYIEIDSAWDEYIQFDLRFSNQIICRKHQ